MPVGRIVEASLALTGPEGRIFEVSLTGTGLPQGRILEARFTGSAAVLLEAFESPRLGEPMTSVVVSAVLLTGGTPSWAWRQISGPAVTLTGSGSSRTFSAPATMDGVSIQLGVRATVDGVQSPEQTVTIDVPPQIVWTRAGTSEWRPGQLSL